MQFYIREEDANDPHKLPDGEVYYVSAYSVLEGNNEGLTPGFYYSFLDGGLDVFSSRPYGPFNTEAEALADARDSWGD